MTAIQTDRSEIKLYVDGQWYYRGNLSPTWLMCAPRSDGSMSGLAERAPKKMWPKLEKIARQLELL
jgi:hypothetical protein